jgi:hypothetical protein
LWSIFTLATTTPIGMLTSRSMQPHLTLTFVLVLINMLCRAAEQHALQLHYVFSVSETIANCFCCRVYLDSFKRITGAMPPGRAFDRAILEETA